MTAKIPCYLYHKEYGARVFVSHDDIASAKKVGWQESPEAFIKEEGKKGSEPRTPREGVEKSIELLNAELERAQKDAREMLHTTVTQEDLNGEEEAKIAQKKQEVAKQEMELHDANKNGVANGEREDLTENAGDRIARMGLDAAASTQAAPKTKAKPLGKK
jgi:hypothetical protein